MWQYLQSVVNNNRIEENCNTFLGLGSILDPAPNPVIKCAAKIPKNSQQLLEKVLNSTKTQHRQYRKQQTIGGTDYAGGLGLLLEDPQDNYYLIQNQIYSEEKRQNNLNQESQLNQITPPKNRPRRSLSEPQINLLQSPKFIFSSNGQIRSRRSEAELLVNIRELLQEQLHVYQQQINKLQEDNQAVSVEKNLHVKFQQNEEKYRSNYNMLKQVDYYDEQDFKLSQADLEISPAVQQYLQDSKEHSICDEEYGSVCDSHSTSDYLQTDSPTAKTEQQHMNRGTVRSLTLQMEARTAQERILILSRCASTRNSPQLKRLVQFSDKLQANSMKLSGPTGMYIPDIGPLKPYASHSTKPVDGKKSTSEAHDQTNLTFKEMIARINKRTEEATILQNQHLESISYSADLNKLQTNSHDHQSSSKYLKILNSWKQKHEDLIQQISDEINLDSNNSISKNSDSIDYSNVSQTDPTNCLSISQACQLFASSSSSEGDEDLQSLYKQQGPLSLAELSEHLNENQCKEKTQKPILKHRSFLGKIEEVQNESTVVPDMQFEISATMTSATDASSSCA